MTIPGSKRIAFLVDTDILVDVAKQRQEAIDLLDSLGGEWAISVVTALELIVGGRNKREVARIDEFISALPVLPLRTSTGSQAYSLLREYAGSHGSGFWMPSSLPRRWKEG